MHKFHLVLLVAALSAGGAFADMGEGPGDGKDKGGKNRPVTQVSLEELRDQCVNWENKPNQRQPQNIRVQCTDTRYTWMPGQPGQVSFDEVRVVTTEVAADKYYVGRIDSEVEMPGKVGSCPSYKEVIQTFTRERPLTCEQLVGMKGSIEDFCKGVVDSEKGQNPKLITTTETGREYSACDSAGTKPKI